MAINKVVNNSTKSHSAMRNVLRYVLQDEKVKEGYVEISGPYSGEDINFDEINRAGLEEKRLWGKDSGRMYAHNIISFHEREKITPQQVLEIGRDFAEKFFPGHQFLIGVHQDKNHLHCHIITNTVSYIDGMKLHQTKRDLERQKEFTNNLCQEKGFSVARKGHHFDGSVIEEGEITAWSKDKYRLLINDSKKSFVAECAIAILEVIPQSTNKEEFISGMKERGWSVQWVDNRKHIVFQNAKGQKVRDTIIEKTFAGIAASKEALTNEFERQNILRTSLNASREPIDPELEKYYAEVNDAAAGLDYVRAVRNDTAAKERTRHNNSGMGAIEEARENSGSGDNTEAFLRDLDTQEAIAEKIRDDRVSKRKNRDAKQRRLDLEQEQRTGGFEPRTISERGEGSGRERER